MKKKYYYISTFLSGILFLKTTENRRGIFDSSTECLSFVTVSLFDLGQGKPNKWRIHNINGSFILENILLENISKK
jgi:hypothetical protein